MRHKRPRILLKLFTFLLMFSLSFQGLVPISLVEVKADYNDDEISGPWAPTYTNVSVSKVNNVLYKIKSEFMWSDVSGFDNPHNRYEHEIVIDNWNFFDCIYSNYIVIEELKLIGNITNQAQDRFDQMHSPMSECIAGSATSNFSDYYIDTRLFDKTGDGEVFTIGINEIPEVNKLYNVEFTVISTSNLEEAHIKVEGTLGHAAGSDSAPYDASITPNKERLFCALIPSATLFKMSPLAACTFKSSENQILIPSTGFNKNREFFTLKTRYDHGTPSPDPNPIPNPNPTTEPTLPNNSSNNNAQFIKDETIPDGTKVGANSTFIKKWKIKNAGTSTWTTGYKLAYQYGHKMGGPNYVNIPQNVAPGQTIDVALNLTSPNSPGSYRGYWKMQNAAAQEFGDILWVDIKVEANAQPVNLTGQVQLYSVSGFNGLLSSHGQGITNDPNANSYALKIPGGMSVKAYKGNDRTGEEKCWFESVQNLQDFGWHNAIQSLEVFNYNACTNGQKVKLYKLDNHRELIGEYNPTSTGTDGPSKDSFSMKIPDGWSVKVWDKDGAGNQGGNSRCFESFTSTHNLQDFTWHLRIDSMRIYTYNDCGTYSETFARLCRITGAHAGTDCHTIREDVPDLGQQGFGDNAVKSIWMQGPWEIMLFEHPNYGGARFKYRENDNDIRNKPANSGGGDYGGSSVKVRQYGEGYVTLYAEVNFNDGNPFKTDNTLDHLGHWDYDNRAKSVKVRNGYEAILCTEANFHGKCGKLKGSDPEVWGADLNQLIYGLKGDVGSVRVCKDHCEFSPPVPNLLETNDESNLLPDSPVNFYWAGDGDTFQIELSGGNLASPIKSDWLTTRTWTKTGLTKSATPYVWKVKAWNPFGESNWSEPKELFIKEIAPVEAFVVVPDKADKSTEFEAYAYVSPADVSNLTYTWSPTPISGQGTAFAKYNFATTGNKEISLTVNNTGATKQASKTVEIVNPIPPCTNIFCAEYFNNTNMSGTPVYTNTTPEIDYDWGGGGPGNGVNNDNFSARWIGNFTFDASNYKFTGWSDDGIRLFVDGIQVMEDWIDHGVRDVIANKTMTAGTHELKVEFKEAGGGAVAGLEWEKVTSGGATNCTTIPTDSFCTEYFNNTDMSGTPAFVTTNASIDKEWGAGGPGNGVNNDSFSDKWIGKFTFESGNYEFKTTSDNGVRLYVDDVLKINNWVSHPPQDDIQTVNMTAGVHTIKVEHYENTGDASIKLQWTKITSSNDCTTIPTNSYCVEYFNNMALTGNPVYVTNASEVNKEWGTNGPGNGVNVDSFSDRWIGKFTFEAGDYEFETFSDNGVKLYVDNVLKINNWTSHPPETDNATVNMTAGVHTIKLEHFENQYDASIKLNWEKVQTAGCTPQVNKYCVNYYNNLNLSGAPAHTASVTTINNHWSGSPASGVNDENFSARWVGTFDFGAGEFEFKTTSDDGIKLYVDNVLIINEWTNHGEQVDTATKTLTAGQHDIKLEFYDAGLDAIAKLSWVELENNEECENEFCGEYFNNTSMSGTPVYTNTTDEIDYDWGGGGPGNGVNNDNFSARWIGDFTFEAGNYEFDSWSDDGMRVYIDGVRIINDWVDHGVHHVYQTTAITAGTHEVKVEYKEAGGGAIAGLSWERQSGIPSGCTNQFCGQYFNNTSLSGTPVYTNTVQEIDFGWNEFGPGNGVNNDNFSARWIGEFDFQADEYTFNSWSDDGIRVWIDGVLFIDDWVDHGVNDLYVPKTMTAGSHEIKVEYKEVGGGAIAGLSWAPSD